MTPPVPENLIMFSTADWAEPYWTNKQHIAQRLARRGANVLYIESTGFRRPGVNARDLRRIADRLRRGLRPPNRVEERLWVYAPLTIPVGQRHGGVQALNGALLRGAIRAWLRARGGGPVTVWTYHPYCAEAVRGLDAEALVYHCVDDIGAMPGVDGAAYDAAERRLLERADVVFATSPRLAEHCADVAGDRTVYERNVADIELFAAARDPGPLPADLAAIPGPRLCYVGVLSDFKLDFALLETCARARPEWHIVLIGDEPARQESPALARLARLPNVHLLGYRPPSALPGYLRGMDVALLPNLTEGYMASVFPMKFYEYLAAGRPIVATPLPALDGLGDLADIAPPAGWDAAISAALAAPRPAVALDDARLMAFSWNARLDRMLARLAKVRPGGGGHQPRLL